MHVCVFVRERKRASVCLIRLGGRGFAVPGVGGRGLGGGWDG